MGMIVLTLSVILISPNCITTAFAFHGAKSPTGTHARLLGILLLNVKELGRVLQPSQFTEFFK